MVKTSMVLLSLACAFTVAQSATPDVQVQFPTTVHRRLKGTGGGGHGGGGGGHPSGGTSGGHPSGGTSGGHPSDGTSTTTGGGGVIYVGGGGGGYYHNNYNSGSTTTPSSNSVGMTAGSSTGSQGAGSMVMDPDVYVAAPDVALPTSSAMGMATTSVVGAATFLLVVANAL